MFTRTRIAGIAVILALFIAAPGAWAARTSVRLPLQADVPTIDPGLAEDSTSIEVIEQLFLGLTDFDDKTTEAVPELATSWTVSKDGLTYTFKLRKTEWTDGSPVTAHDVVYAVQRNVDKATGSPYAFMLYNIKNAEKINKGEITDATQVGVKATDDYTVVFTLENPAGYFPGVSGMWTLRPLPRKAIEAHKDKWTEPGNIVSNGPYTLDTFKKGDKLVLKKNPKYFDAKNVKIQEIQYLIIPEASTGMAMYEKGDLDMMGTKSYLTVPLPDITRIKGDATLKKEFTIEPALCTYYYGFNTKRPPMDKPLVRKAFSAAIDRQALVDKITKGEQVPATTFTRPPIFGSVPVGGGVGIPSNADQARKYLAEAGYPDGKGFPEVILVHNTSEAHAQIAQAIQQMWAKTLNVKVKVENQEWKVYLKSTKEVTSGHIYRMGWCADYPDANNWLMEVFHPTKSENRVFWDNAEFGKAVEDAQKSQEPAERKKLYRRAEQILTEEQAVIAPIYFYTSPTLAKPYLKFSSAPLGGNHIRDWSLTD